MIYLKDIKAYASYTSDQMFQLVTELTFVLSFAFLSS